MGDHPDKAKTVRITEIFLSLQGETARTGLPTVFVRLTGCPLRCGYCDTAYAFSGGEVMSFKDIVSQVTAFNVAHVTVTGGEPLAQKSCLPLLTELCDQGLSVSLETSGAMDISSVDQRVIKVMDLKTPASGEQDKNRLENLSALNPQDEIKFVICDQTDYQWAKEMIKQYQLKEKCDLLFSPVADTQNPGQLAEWIIQDRLPVRFQLQLHKILWGEAQGR